MIPMGAAATTIMWILTVTALASGTPSAAREPKASSPAAVQDIVRCRAMSDDAARLSCFDTAADRLGTAVTSKDVYVLDRAEVQESRRSLVGLPLPLPLPAQGIISEQAHEWQKVDHIESVAARVSQASDGNWIVTLEQGGTWQQTDGYQLGRGPRKGDKITINRAALGSFKMKVLDHSAVKVRRIS